MAKITDLSGLVAGLTQMGNRLYGKKPTTISTNNPNNWPTAGQPVQPIKPGEQALGFPFQYGQNQIFTPRFDAAYTASDLRQLSMYTLARICIENTKDSICKADWTIQLRQRPGESDSDVAQRRKQNKKGDETAYELSKFFEYPDGEHDWSDWLRPIIEDMLVTDSASVLVVRRGGKIKELRAIPGHTITRYIDDLGFTPKPPDPAYAQLWPEGGLPRTDLTTDELIYAPRNIVPRVGVMSSYIYGCSPCEEIADEIKIGVSRLAYVMAYYDKGSLGNVIHVVPPRVTTDKIREAMQFVNSELSGNFANRRAWRMIPGFAEDGQKENIIIPKEPTLADIFDDLHIRKICFAFGTSPQRLQRAMNRASAQTSQEAAQEEGIAPWQHWVKKKIDYIIQRRFGYDDYEIAFDPYSELDYGKKAKADQTDVQTGIQTRNEVRISRGLDPFQDNPLADKLTVTTPNGTIELGQVIVSGRPDKGGADGGAAGTAKPNGAAKPNGKAILIERGEM